MTTHKVQAGEGGGLEWLGSARGGVCVLLFQLLFPQETSEGTHKHIQPKECRQVQRPLALQFPAGAEGGHVQYVRWACAVCEVGVCSM